jgi:hypothetical protein
MGCIRTSNEVGARSAQGVGKTCTDRKSVRADRRLRTDDETIRAQSAIFEKPVLLVLKRAACQERVKWEIRTICLQGWR